MAAWTTDGRTTRNDCAVFVGGGCIKEVTDASNYAKTEPTNHY